MINVQDLNGDINPGIYDLSIDCYHDSPGISRSGIMKMKKSPYHYWHEYLNPRKKIESKPSQALIIGNALHTKILEPDLFDKLYHIMPKVDARTKVGMSVIKYEKEKSNGKIILNTDEMQLIHEMTYSLYNNADAVNLIRDAKIEKSIYWIDSDTGILCKARPDIWKPNVIADLKTTTDASEHAFRNDVFKYGYHIQAAMIREAIHYTENRVINDFVFIPIEKDAPHASALYILDDAVLNRGHEEFKENLVKYKKCLDSNEWPGYTARLISLPSYLKTTGE